MGILYSIKGFTINLLSFEMLTLTDVATRAGVSITTASFVLNNKEGGAVRISDKTRRKVLETAEEMGYRHNQLARAMRTGNSQMLGVLGGDLSEQHVGLMVSGAIEAADAQGYILKILRFDAFGGDARQVIRRSSELRLMGVLALHLPEETLEELNAEATNYGYPLVLMDSRSQNVAVPQVISDDEGGIDAGVDHLVALGHTRIAFMSSNATQSAFAMARENGFLGAMQRHALPVPAHYIERGSVQEREQSLRAAAALLRLPAEERPTAIFCSSDWMAMATLQAAAGMGIDVPRQCSIVGFANISVSEYVTPQLTTIAQPFKEMGRLALTTLLALFPDKTEAEVPPERVVDSSAEPTRTSTGYIRLPTRLVLRASTAPPPGM